MEKLGKRIRRQGGQILKSHQAIDFNGREIRPGDRVTLRGDMESLEVADIETSDDGYVGVFIHGLGWFDPFNLEVRA